MLFLSAFFQSEELVVGVREVTAEQVTAESSCSTQVSLGYGQSWEKPNGYFNLLSWAKEDLCLKIQRSNQTSCLCLKHKAQRTRLWLTEALWTTWKGSSNHDPESRIKAAAAASQCTRSGSGCPPSVSSQGALGLANTTLLPGARTRHELCCYGWGSPFSPMQQMLRLHESLLSKGCSTPRHYSGSSTCWAVQSFSCQKNITMPFIPWDKWEVCTLHILSPGSGQPAGYHQVCSLQHKGGHAAVLDTAAISDFLGETSRLQHTT